MNWVYVASTGDILPGSARIFRKQDGKEISIFHLTDGRVLALRNRCPHKGGPLSEGIVSNHYVFCPLHDWKINLEDGQVQAPDTGCVKTFPVKVEGGKIFVAC